MNKKPLYTNEYIGHAGVKYLFEYFDSDHLDNLPIEKIKQCYAIAFYEDKFIVVNNKNKPNSYTPIGGGVDKDEKPEQTLIREIKEESNMKVLKYQLIGYQKVVDTRGIEEDFYQLRYFALVEPYGPFIQDPAGDVTEIVYCDKNNYKKYFDWGEIGDHIINRAYLIKAGFDSL